jgi:hypothetical protein
MINQCDTRVTHLSDTDNSTKTVAKTTKGNIFKKETIQAPSGKTYNFNATKDALNMLSSSSFIKILLPVFGL